MRDEDDEELEKQEKKFDFGYVITNEELFKITSSDDISAFFREQQQNWVAHIIRQPNHEISKELLFNSEKNHRRGPLNDILHNVVKNQPQEKGTFVKNCFMRRVN